MPVPSASRVLSNSSNAARELIEPTFEVSEPPSFMANLVRLASQRAGSEKDGRAKATAGRRVIAGSVQDVLS